MDTALTLRRPIPRIYAIAALAIAAWALVLLPFAIWL